MGDELIIKTNEFLMIHYRPTYCKNTATVVNDFDEVFNEDMGFEFDDVERIKELRSGERLHLIDLEIIKM